MKHSYWKYILLVIATLVLLACALQLFFTIIVNIDLDLDFSLQGRINHWLGIRGPQPELYGPMLIMLLGGFLAVGTLIVRQFIGEYRRARNLLTPAWIACSRKMQLWLGSIAVVLLLLIGLCLNIQGDSGLPPYAFCFVLLLRLAAYAMQTCARQK